MTRLHTTAYVPTFDLMITDMVLRAFRLAPKVAAEARDTADGFTVTTARPSGPNQAKAWGLINDGLLLCAIRRNSLLIQKVA